MSKRELFSRFKKFDKELEKKPEYVTGLLGIPLGGDKIVEIPTRNGYVFVRLRDSQDELVQAFNDKVSPVYDLPVIVQYKDGRYVIIGRDTNRYGDWGDFSSYLPRHGSTHSFSTDTTSGGDIVWVYSRQFMPYLAQPSGTAGSPHLIINSYLYLKSDGTWRYDDQVGTSSLLGYKPTGSGAVMVLIYENGDAGTLAYSAGSNFSESLTGTSQIDTYIPSLSDTTKIPIAAVRLVSGTSAIGWDNIYDARQFFSRGGGGTTTGSIAIYDEGILQGQATEINFVGDNVVATLSGQRARVFITGSTGGLSSVSVQDEGIPQGNVTTFNFVGDGIFASVSGTVANILVTGTPGTQGPTGSQGPVGPQGPAGSQGLMAWDEGTPIGTGTIFNFVGANVDASISGSVVRVFVTGSTGGASCNNTYQRFEQPINIGGTLFQVPDLVYASGSLGVFYNGLMQAKGVHYEELIYVSGTYHLLFTPETGTYHMVSYGISCTAQTYSTGTISNFALADSDVILLLDSDSEQLLDSDG